MSYLDAVAGYVFWASTATVVTAYFGYPVAVWILARLFGRPPMPPANKAADLPFVSLLVAAHNEEADIEARVKNALAMQYPPDKFEIVIASDGSTDRTNEIVGRYVGRNVRLLAFSANRGKAAVLNDAFPELRGSVIVLSDANTHMEPDAIRRLATWFADPAIGVVCGRLILTDPRTGRNVDGVYWKYETFLKKCESRLGALLGSNGAIYAIRRGLFPGVRDGTIIDDFVIPLEARRLSGCRIVYDTAAVAWEETAPDIQSEFRRRARIGAGGFQSLGILWPLLNPLHGWVAFTFFFHKILRWVCPFCLIVALVANLCLLAHPLYQGLMGMQVAFYATAVLANWAPSQPKFLRLLKLPTMFVGMNLALLVGFFRWAGGTQKGTWRRTDRGHSPELEGSRWARPAGAAP